MHWYRRTAATRFVALVLLCIATFALAEQPTLLLAVFFVVFSIYSFGGGVSGIPWLEMVSKTIARGARGTFFSLRSFWAGVLALLASSFIAAILSEQWLGLIFPYNFAVLFVIATTVVGLALMCWALIREPAATQTASSVTVTEVLRRGWRAVKLDRDYRLFMGGRILLALASISDPFYAVFASTQLGAPPATVGLYLGASTASTLLSNFVWGPLSNRATNRTLMTMTVISVLLVPLSALLIPLARTYYPANVVSTWFAAVFVFAGFAGGAGRIVNNNMMLTIAPPAERATYVGFSTPCWASSPSCR